MSEVSNERLATIRGLLSKAESSQFPAEAEAFLAKATVLMAKYSLDEATVWGADTGNRKVPGSIKMSFPAPYALQKMLMAHLVAKSFNCKAIRIGDGVMHIFGFDSDLVMVETLITSLMLQSVSAMSRTKMPEWERSTTAWRRSFMIAFAERVGARLQEQMREAAVECDSTTGSSTKSSTAIVLRERKKEVDVLVKSTYSRLGSSRMSGGSSRSGRDAGTTAGNRADLGGQRVGSGGNRAIGTGR